MDRAPLCTLSHLGFWPDGCVLAVLEEGHRALVALSQPGSTPSHAWAGCAPRGAGTWTRGWQMGEGGRLCPRVPSHTMLCAQLCLAALSLFPGKLGCPSALSWKLGEMLQRDWTNVSLLRSLSWLAGAVWGERQTGRWQWQGGRAALDPSAYGDMTLHGPAHIWCLLCHTRLCSFACSVAGAVLPRTEFLSLFHSWGLGRAQPWSKYRLFSHVCPTPFASTALCGTWGQRSSTALSLHSRNNTLSWQPRCLAQQSTAGQTPGAVAPRVPQSLLQQGGPGLMESLSQHLHEDQGTGSPRHAQGGGWRGLEIRQQTQHGGVGRGGTPFPALLNGVALLHCQAWREPRC